MGVGPAFFEIAGGGPPCLWGSLQHQSMAPKKASDGVGSGVKGSVGMWGRRMGTRCGGSPAGEVGPGVGCMSVRLEYPPPAYLADLV